MYVANRHNQTAFTVIETLFTVALVAVAAVMIVFALRSFTRVQEVTNQIDRIAGVVQKAQSQTLAGEGDVSYGVHFDSDQIVIFQGDTYSDADSNNVVYAIDNVGLSWTFTGGGDDIIFARLTGMTTQTGTVTVTHMQDNSINQDLTINSLGQTE